jgi:Sulfotransferase family
MYAFVHIEKTAGSTLNVILRRSFGTRHCDIRLPLKKRRHDHDDHRAFVEAADLHRVRRLYRSLRGIAGHNVKPYADLHAECPEIQFFTVLRDPAARFRSHFLNRAPGHTRAAFDSWTADPSSQNWQTKMIAGEPNAQKAIDLISTRFGFVGLTERFDESLVLLGQWIREPAFQPEYRAVNQLAQKQRPRDIARKKDDMTYLESEATRARIREVNAEDQKVYDFVTAKIYPQQIANFQGDLTSELQALQSRNRELSALSEPFSSSFLRNYIYKPLLHCYAI